MTKASVTNILTVSDELNNLTIWLPNMTITRTLMQPQAKELKEHIYPYTFAPLMFFLPIIFPTIIDEA